MKQAIFLLLVLGSSFLRNISWAAVAPAASDTIPGQSQLVKQMTTDACQQLERENSQTAVAGYTATQAQAMFELAISTSITARKDQIRALAKRSSSQEGSLMAQLPTALAIQLIKNCTAAKTLYSRFQENTALEAGEKSFVQSFSTELCGQLDLLHTKGAFKGKSPEQRVELFHQAFLQSLKTKGPQIMELYGPAGNSAQVVSALGKQVVESMQQQCPQSLLLLGRSD